MKKKHRQNSNGLASHFAIIYLATLVILAGPFARAAVYEVGPSKSFANIGDVAWESLQAGDTVLIYWRANAYKEKWVLCRQGQTNAPITIRGVPGPNGELPLIDGENATTRTSLTQLITFGWRGIVREL